MGKRRTWTKSDAEYIRDKILPKCRTVQEAHHQAVKKFKRKLSPTFLRALFREHIGSPPAAFLAKDLQIPVAPDLPPDRNPVILKRKIRSLEKQIKGYREQHGAMALIKSTLRGAADYREDAPSWTYKAPKRGKIFHGVPTLFLSDWHYGERVFAAQVNYANKFDVDIANARARRTFERAIYLLEGVFSNASYPGIVVPLGGDMVSGNIHEELRETNDVPIFDAVMGCADQLTAGIRLLKDRFKRVFVPCVVGNHGRLDRKPRAKYGPHDNFEYMLYHIIASRFDHDKDVTVCVSDAFTFHYRVFSTRYLLTHGDAFKGGSGITGPLLPWTLGDHRLRKQMQTLSPWTKSPTEYDVLIFGHWHRYFPGRQFVVNGSLKGFDEYSKKMGFTFEPPQQALWLTSPEYGMSFNAPVFAEDLKLAKKDGGGDWVSIPDVA